MSRAKTTAIGAALGLVVVLSCLGSAAFVQWYEEGREISLCNAAKDFWDQNHRAPTSIDELPEPYASYTERRDGTPYEWTCTREGGVPWCSVNWSGPGPNETTGRSCGALDQRDVTDWF